MVTVLSFDIGGTLIKGGEAGFCSFLCDSLGYSLESLRSLIERHFLTSSKPITQSLNEFYDEMNIPFNDRKYPKYNRQSTELYDDVILNLQRIKEKGFRLISLSNCTRWEAEESLPVKLETLLEASFRSFEIGWAKPNIKAFEAVETSLGLEPKEFIHIGDSWKADIVGALSSGWQAIYLNRQSSRSYYMCEKGVPSINSLNHLIQVLEV